ncbi:MAG: hypothetical protein JSW05_02440 [Candidatus Thorarchaeota archaeon]|nr:MAG: hypothetical protein JSW05_02440 [Candidatus Thorarchaeota archaeon]
MTAETEKLTRKLRRRRQRFYVLAAIIVTSLMVSGIWIYAILGPTDEAITGLVSSLVLSFSALLVIVVPIRDLRRTEQIILLAAVRGGTIKMEEVRRETGLPKDKILTLLRWLEKQGMAESRDDSRRWVFPGLRRSLIET